MRKGRRPGIADWLSDYLLWHGPTRRSELIKLAVDKKIGSASALDRAAAVLKIPRGSHWRLPE